MANIPSCRFDITGASGSQGLLGPKDSWRAYVLERGGNASQDSTGTLITFDTAAIASRFAVSDWIQAGLLTANIRQVGSVGGNSINVSGAALTVTENQRIFIVGVTEPTLMGNSATYYPSTTIRQRGDDSADTYTNSMVTTNSDGLVQFYAAPQMYDVIVQDGNQSNQGYIADLEVGTVEGVSVIDAAYFGSTVTFSGNQVGISTTSAAVFGSTVTMNSTLGVTGAATFGSSVTVHTIYGRSATPGLNGPTDATMYFDVTRDMTTITSAKAYKGGEVVQRSSGTPAFPNTQLHGFHAINRYGSSGVGGGSLTTGIALGAYSEYYGNLGNSGSYYGAECATTCYSGSTGLIENIFGALCTGQIAETSNIRIGTALIGVQGLARVTDTATGTIPLAMGVEGIAALKDTCGASMTNAVGGRFSVEKDAGATGQITTAMSVYALLANDGSTNNYGVRIQGASGGSNINRSLSVDDGETAIEGSYCSTFQALAGNSGIPSVKWKQNLVTANTASTTYSNFTNSVNGQVIRVLFGDTYSTVDFTGTNLTGNAGSDWTPTTGDHMECVVYAGIWRCRISDNTA